jgi:TonB family protein
MKAQRFVVTTTVSGKSKSEVWNTQKPLGLGHPFLWVLEQGSKGPRFRNVRGGAGEVKAASVIDAAADREIELPHPSGDPAKPAMKVQLRAVRPVRPAYIPLAEMPGFSMQPQLLAFAGVRRTVISSQAVHSAYVAYARGKPAFTIYHQPEGFKIKPLLEGVQIKLKGERATPGKIGESWNLTPQQISTATMIRGRYWWRFSLVESAGPLANIAREDDEMKIFKRALWGVLFALIFITGLAMLWPAPEKPPEEEKKKDPQEVKLMLPRPKLTSRTIKDRSEELPPAKVARQEPKAAPKAQPKPEPAQTRVEKPEPKKAQATSSASNAGQKSKASAGKSESATAKAAPRPSNDNANAAAASAAAMLKSALGGAQTLARKSVTNQVAAGGSRTAGDIFTQGAPAFSATQVRPGFAGSTSAVSSMGGGGGETAAGNGKKGGVGYGSGDRGTMPSGGGSFVSMDSGGSSVEEGLTKEEVGAVIHKHMNEVRYCHESAMVANPKIEGKAVLSFTIGPNGAVKSSVISSSNLPDRALAECVNTRLKTWQFPHPKGGVNVSVSYPFLFKILGR